MVEHNSETVDALIDDYTHESGLTLRLGDERLSRGEDMPRGSKTYTITLYNGNGEQVFSTSYSAGPRATVDAEKAFHDLLRDARMVSPYVPEGVTNFDVRNPQIKEALNQFSSDLGLEAGEAVEAFSQSVQILERFTEHGVNPNQELPV